MTNEDHAPVPPAGSPRPVVFRISCARSSVLPVLVALALAAGCSSSTGLEPPTLTLTDLAVVDATLFETTLDVAVRISNDNPEPLLVDGVVVKLELGGRGVGKGSSPEPVEIPRFGSALRRLEIHLNNLAVASRLRSILESSTVDWGLAGKVWVVSSSGRVRALPFESRGRLDLREPAAGEAVD
jgi:LEA14-like dessication related protein